MRTVIECAGNPRDMGLGQGGACRKGVRELVLAAGLPIRRSRLPGLAPFAAGAVLGSGRGREVIRHFTHLSERMDGLAREAGVPVDSLMRLHLDPRVRDAREGADHGGLNEPAVAALGVDLAGTSGLMLARSLPAYGGPESGWLVRRSSPEVGFASVEVTLPWLVSAVAGVNEAGLCVAIVPARDRGDSARTAPPFMLLVQECLQRFEAVETATDWCVSRPASGAATLLIGDAEGSMAAVQVSGEERDVEVVGEDRLLLAGASESLHDRIVRTRRIDGEALLADLPKAPERVGGSPPSWVRLDAAERLLELEALGPRRTTIRLEV